MSIAAAKKCLQTAMSDSIFRKRINKSKTQLEIQHVLKEYDIEFSPFEFEEAFTAMHLECQTNEQADSLFNTKNWFVLNWKAENNYEL